jgi:molecular chaperone GrpE
MKRKHDREGIEEELARKAAEAAQGDVSESELAEEDGAVAGTAGEASDGAAPERAPADEAKDRALAELQDRLLRLTAEYENYQRRTQREKEQLYAESVTDVVAQWVPVLDNLERAAAVAAASPSPDAAKIADGIGMVLRQASETMARLKVEEIPALGTAFDPHLHNAVMHVEDESVGPGQVVEVFMKGYRCGGRVIRHSMVKVAN